MVLNAVESIETEGEIKVRTRKSGDRVRIEIQDSGRGIPAEIQHRIFQPNVSVGKNGEPRGGDGLTIARQVVEERHQGTIALENDVEGGTLCVIEIPLAK